MGTERMNPSVVAALESLERELVRDCHGRGQNAILIFRDGDGESFRRSIGRLGSVEIPDDFSDEIAAFRFSSRGEATCATDDQVIDDYTATGARVAVLPPAGTLLSGPASKAIPDLRAREIVEWIDLIINWAKTLDSKPDAAKLDEVTGMAKQILAMLPIDETVLARRAATRHTTLGDLMAMDATIAQAQADGDRVVVIQPPVPADDKVFRNRGDV